MESRPSRQEQIQVEVEEIYEVLPSESRRG
jgi:hypothetical protein